MHGLITPIVNQPLHHLTSYPPRTKNLILNKKPGAIVLFHYSTQIMDIYWKKYKRSWIWQWAAMNNRLTYCYPNQYTASMLQAFFLITLMFSDDP